MRHREEYEQRVRDVMDFVRANLSRSLPLEEVARVAGFSPYHFHRIYRAIAGETLASFTRRARLERAAYLMKSSPNRPLGSIALEVGFSAQSDFSRVFKQAFGIAPSEWDRVELLRPAEASDGGEPGTGGGPGRYGRPDPPIETAVREHPAVRIAYIRMSNLWGDPAGPPFPAAWETLTNWLSARGLEWDARPVFGLSWDHYDTTPLDQVRFDLGIGVPAEIEAEGPIGIHEIPAVTAVNAHSAGPMLRIAQAWDHLYLEWLPDSPYEPASLPAMKRFRRRPDVTGWDRWDVDCSIAIVRRGAIPQTPQDP